MKFIQIAFPILLFYCMVSACSPRSTGEPGTSTGPFETQLEYSKFIDPPAKYRSFPFYSINDRLDSAELHRQINGFKKAGFGGFYLHSRNGLLTDFLSDEWWTMMNAAVEAGNSNGLHTMFYDEDKWPSGYAGGIIPEMDKDFRAKCLARLDRSIPLPEGSLVLKEDSAFRYIEYTASLGNPIFNGTCYVDLMNPKMVQAFLDVSYRPYIEKYKSKIQGYVPGVFADEPHIHARYFDPHTPHRGLYSYSPYVREKFKQLFGYDVIDRVELLFEEKDNWREVRLQYHQAVALQFEESFSRQIAQYCSKNGFQFTGHYLAEDVLEKVRDRAGNTMLHYRQLQQPGIDVLGLGFEGKLLTSRALSSVANQYDKPRRLTELYALSGQNMSFEDRKWLAGWHVITGVNHFCPHLAQYSLTGLRKRDYPPTFSYHQPYWSYNKILEDYLGRISYAATIGKYAPQILVINPLESEFVKGDREGAFTKPLLDVLEALQQAHIDYDLGDEQIMADIARVKGNRIIIGAMSYEAIVLPDMLEIRSSTAKLLKQFASKGGKVLSCGRFPQFIDGKADSISLAALNNQTIVEPPVKWDEELKSLVHPNVQIGNDQGKVWSQVRLTDSGSLILLYNTSHVDPISFTIRSGLIGERPVLWDPSLASCFSLNPDTEENYHLNLTPSSLVWISSGSLSQEAQIGATYTQPEQGIPLMSLQGPWECKRLDPNVMTLDFASYSVDQGESFSQPEPLTGIFSRLCDQNFSGPLILRYPFSVNDKPLKAALAAENPDQFSSISLNGNPLSFIADSFYIDRKFRVGDVSRYLKKGTNLVEFRLQFRPVVETSRIASERYGSEIESIYLLGDFGVRGLNHELTMDTQRNRDRLFQPRPVHQFRSFSVETEKNSTMGDLVSDGYPFYSGRVELSRQFIIDSLESGHRYFIDFPNTESIVALVTLNGISLDTLTWAPFRTDLTPALKSGENQLTITLISSLRNVLGPHHQKGGELTRVGPFSFGGAGGFPDPGGDRNWYDLRLEGKATRIWTDTYSMIPFGFIEPPVISIE